MADVQRLQELLRDGLSGEDQLDAFDELAGHFFDLDDYSEAAKYYQEGERLSPPGNERAYFSGQRGICLYLDRQDEAAIRSLISARSMFNPEAEDLNREVYARVYFFLGSSFEYNGDNENSLLMRLEALKHIDELDEESQWMLLSGLSRNYELQSQPRKALEYSMQAISLISRNDPEVAYLYESMAVNHCELGEIDEALSCFGKVLTIDPDFERKDQIYHQIALCYQKLLDFRMALGFYGKLLELRKLSTDPKESLLWISIRMADCHYRLKEYGHALEVINEALREPIDNADEMAELRSYLTNCYRHMGRPLDAVREGERTLQISNAFHGMEEMLANLAMSCYDLNEGGKFQFYRDWCNRSFPDFGWTKHLNKLKA